ncbi:hypothetical protein QFC19_006298 [Naganishia cerealis]|uniref:Uncharacterized protein n=1 Tax=Naganishia cerealis TaxID=610337 RepID=A0ACC2VGK2_9TREE|nr:hypothetical protein QFC19_006298 [Naganishia cerealis]
MSDTATHSHPTSVNFDVAVKVWKDISLSTLQKNMDTTALEIVETQKENMIGRKRLAEQTREFKRLPDDDIKLSSIKGLLRSYQQEIDSLTRRSQRSESMFLNIYKLLAEAPDPYPLLEAAIHHAIQAEEASSIREQCDGLQRENAVLRSDVASFKGAEERRKRAEAKILSLEEKMESVVTERLQQKENELIARYDERLRNYQEREVDLQKQLTSLRAQLTDLHSSNENTQARLADASQRLDQDTVAKLLELDFVVAELQRANERVATVENRNETLRSAIERAKSESGETELIQQLRKQIQDLETEVGRIIELNEGLKRDKLDGEEKHRKQDESLSRALTIANREIDHLREKLDQFQDYDEVKRELEIMKYVEFGNADADIDVSDNIHLPNPNANKSNSELGNSLESLLSQSNKRLQEENAKLRVANEEYYTRNHQLNISLTNAQNEIACQSTLIQKLENDLDQIQMNGKPLAIAGGESSKFGSDWGDGVNPLYGKDAESLHDKTGLAILSLRGRSNQHSTQGPIQAIASESTASSEGDRSILPIVTGQRDRFRRRNAELEELDNLKLYEKVRYMQSYRTDASIGSPDVLVALGVDNQATSLATSELVGRNFPTRSREEDIGKYKDKYEQSMNPFEAFRGR